MLSEGFISNNFIIINFIITVYFSWSRDNALPLKHITTTVTYHKTHRPAEVPHSLYLLHSTQHRPFQRLRSFLFRHKMPFVDVISLL